MAINRTVGTGGDHTDWQAAWNWLATQAPLTNNYIFTQISDITMPASAWTVGALNCGNNSITFQCLNSHNGDPNEGYQTGVPSDQYALNLSWPTNFDTVTINGLRIVKTVQDTVISNIMINFGSANEDGIYIVSNCLFKGLYAGAGDLGGHAFPSYRLNANNCRIYNCKFWDLNDVIDNSGIAPDTGTDYTCYMENCTAYACGNGVYLINSNNRNFVLRNVVIVDSVVDDYQLQDGGTRESELYNCADSDGTLGTIGGIRERNVSNVTSADAFESLDDTSSDFLTLPDGDKSADASASPQEGAAPLDVQFNSDILFASGESDLIGVGTVPLYAGSLDVAGISRPDARGAYSIGCHETAYACNLVRRNT